jgi:hypothetical protein
MCSHDCGGWEVKIRIRIGLCYYCIPHMEARQKGKV